MYTTKKQTYASMAELLQAATFIKSEDAPNPLRVDVYDVENDLCLLTDEVSGEEHEITQASESISFQDVIVLSSVESVDPDYS